MECRTVHKDLIYGILSVVEEIPKGYVATYDQIARLIGRDKNFRPVGEVLGVAEYYGDHPCHRVVNRAGRPILGWLKQRLLLEAEQVAMRDDRHADLKKCRWNYWKGGGGELHNVSHNTLGTGHTCDERRHSCRILNWRLEIFHGRFERESPGAGQFLGVRSSQGVAQSVFRR